MLIQEDWEREFLKAEIYIIEKQKEIEEDFYKQNIPAKITLINLNIEEHAKRTTLSF